MTTPTTLYRLYNSTDVLLYVGIGGNPGRRWQQHRGAKHWWGDVTRVTLEHHPTREEALAAELDAIRAERPLHNIAGRVAPTYPPRFVPPKWIHQSIALGAYLNIERTPHYTTVEIDRDEATNAIGPSYQVPDHVLEATERAARAGARRLWAEGCTREEFPVTAGQRCRRVHVPHRFEHLAIGAMEISEVFGEISRLEQLTLALEAGAAA